MIPRSAGAARRPMALGLCLTLCACSSAPMVEQEEPGGGGGARGVEAPDILEGLGFVASGFGFPYSEDPTSGVEGFDLDGRVSTSGSPGEDECAHDDFAGPSGEPGIDYNFLTIINDEQTRDDGKHVFGGFREGQLVDGVIGGAVKNGSMTILLRLKGVDDRVNDDEVVVQVYASEDSPALGTDNSVLPGATLSIHPDSKFHTAEVDGAIVDGVLTAGPFDLLFPIDIMIVKDEMLIHDSWLRVELGDGTFEGLVSGYWDVSNIRDIIGKPTTDNGDAANFTIEQFDAAMAERADGDYDPETKLCTSFSTTFQIRGVQAFLASASDSGSAGGTCGPAGDDGTPTPVDQCVNPSDQAAIEALATAEQSGPAALGALAADCPISSCGAEIGVVLTDSSEEARNALGDCIARCISDQTGLSVACTACYGSIAACSTGCCLEPCLEDAGSEECASCALNSCIDVNACTGLY